MILSRRSVLGHVTAVAIAMAATPV
ncbi:twin-arginine translocation signal domain-containing protein [Mycobacterium sp. ACS4331]